MTRVGKLAITLLTFALPLGLATAQGPDTKSDSGRREGSRKRDSAPAKEQEKEKGKDSAPAKEKDSADDAKPTVTHHEIKIGERTLKYTATTGLMPIRDAKGDVEAKVFFIAYTKDEVKEKTTRPLMFSFNGGPGSSSVWLHLGALGPKRVEMPDEPVIPSPPFRLVDNEQTWLDATDLVFIDPVGTGFSRAAKPELDRKFHSVRGDIESVGEFIRMYLTRYERWSTPLYLVGESYGTTRAAGLSDHLVDHGIAPSGILLISSVLNFQTLSFNRGNDLPYVLYLPTYAATAWYHGKLSRELQKDLKSTLDEVRKWAETTYSEALEKGDLLSPADRKDVVEKLAKYTGLDASFIDQSDLRVEIQRFCKELLRSQRRTVGRLDSRYKGMDASGVGSSPEFDPSMAAIRPIYTATWNQYVRTELEYKSDVPYHILGEGVGPWEWGPNGRVAAEVSSALRDAMAKNPSMRVFIGSGYYDLATPFAATDYTFAHMKLDPDLRKNVRTETYEAGHMMYAHKPSLIRLKEHAEKFVIGPSPK
jgi:carboxypeptidase C (cathepsin A)